ncbi:class I SAM-dependent methyltransferase [Mesorhizobium sp. NPDC059025]|jgi:2-polyprenyl-3-methyl-5-hydroxy-6-metoxy-1,4-benzoquinol methylase|uniref:class I SAM-dependent methyltransferase n=1 Tax=unclassified Mesorhizobium TaxID=325217 RepID=UPI00369CC5DF
MNETTPAAYILGHSASEIRRLVLQAEILKPITARLLREAGIVPGMRVLDVGCGAGDVAMLACEMVGPAGLVVGIDRSADAIAVAQQRAAGYPQAVFEAEAVEDFVDEAGFDLVIGRYVLVHQTDPVALVRRVTELVRPGGIVAFHEVSHRHPFASLPAVPLWEQVGDWLFTLFHMAAPHHDAADKLFGIYTEAGLPAPSLFSETPVAGGPDAPHHAWIAETIRSLLPKLVQLGLATEAIVDIDTLEARLREATVAVQGQIIAHAQVCAWARRAG